jgi:hypothetical protein
MVNSRRLCAAAQAAAKQDNPTRFGAAINIAHTTSERRPMVAADFKVRNTAPMHVPPQGESGLDV